VQYAGIVVDVVVDGFEISDAVRLPADVGVNRDRHDFRPLGALAVEPLEAVDTALREIGRFMIGMSLSSTE
jgi:hypothetical protein